MDIGPAELILIAAVLLVLFGGKKLPELARGLGQAQREFRDAMRDEPEPEPEPEPDGATEPVTEAATADGATDVTASVDEQPLTTPDSRS